MTLMRLFNDVNEACSWRDKLIVWGKVYHEKIQIATTKIA